MIAEQESETATPASSRVEVSIPCRRMARPDDQRGRAERSGEAREAHQRQPEELPPSKRRAITAPRAAPLDTPRV